MAYIKKIKEGTETIYPATIPQAVVDPTSGKTVREELDEKAASAELAQLAGDIHYIDDVTFVDYQVEFEQGGFNASGVPINSTTRLRSDYIRANAITVSVSQGQYISIFRYDENGNFIDIIGPSFEIALSDISFVRLSVRKINEQAILPNESTAVVKIDRLHGRPIENNIVLDFTNNASTTRRTVKLKDRRKGLIISYNDNDNDNDNDNNYIIEQYVGSIYIDSEWGKDSNWAKLDISSDIFKKANDNLFDGVYKPGAFYATSFSGYIQGSDGRIAVIPIHPDTVYSVAKHSESNRFRIGVSAELPDWSTGAFNIDRLVFFDDAASTCSFTTDDNENYLIIGVSSISEEPRLKVENNDTPTPYYTYEIIEDKLNFLDSFTEEYNTNLFDGNYLTGYALNKQWGQILQLFSNVNGVVAIIPVRHNTTYRATKFGESDRMRIAFFNEYPNYTEGDVQNDGYVITDDLDTTSVFTTGDSTQYVAIQVSITRGYPPLKVSKGVGVQSLKVRKLSSNIVVLDPVFSEKSIDRSALIDGDKIAILDNMSPYDVKPTFILDKIYEAPDSLTPILTGEVDAMYSLYDNLLAQHPQYISMNILGLDSIGNEIREYKFKAPKVKGSTGNELFKTKDIEIALLTGVHGNERTAVYTAYLFFEEMFNSGNQLLSLLRWNINFSIIPIVNPSGFEAYTRTNVNGIDLNRNYLPEGDPDTPEMEVVIVQNWMKALKDVFYFIDFHLYATDRPVTYVENARDAAIVEGLYRALTGKWIHEYPDIVTEYDIFGWILPPITGDDSTRYARGIDINNAVTFEVPTTYPFGTEMNSVDWNRASLEVFVNYILLLIQ